MPLNEFLVLILEKTARVCGSFAEKRLSRFIMHLLPELPILEDHWIAEFDDPTKSGKRRRACVHVRLKQFGRHVSGTGYVQQYPADTFTFSGTIRRNVLFGSFHRDDSHVLAGTGTFVLKVTAHSRVMEGQCLWYDGLLDDVWVSRYQWKRARKADASGV